MSSRAWAILFLSVIFMLPAVIAGTAQDTPKSTHELVVEAPDTLTPGSRAAIRLSVFSSTGLFEFKPAPETPVSLMLRSEGGTVAQLFTGRTDRKGSAAVTFNVPDLPEGDYEIEIRTESDAGRDVQTRKVRLTRAVRILLTTDKPLYQPGQLIHIRALALESISLRPVSAGEIRFEVQDPKGNKVFKRSVPASKFGVAAVDFQLASELNHGPYRISAFAGKAKSEKSIEVKRYVLPKFKITTTPDRKYYRPKETVKGTVEARYIFGKPVAGAKVVLRAKTFDVQLREFAKHELKTNDSGIAEFEFTLPDYFVGTPLNSGNAFVSLDVQVVDTADHSERAEQRVTVCSRPVLLALLPESGRLVGGVENIVYAVASAPNGEPVEAGLTVEIAGSKQEVRTNKSGYAEFRFTPEKKQIKVEHDWNTGKTKHYYDAAITVMPTAGGEVRIPVRLDVEADAEGMLIRAGKALYRTGDRLTVDLFSRTPAGMVFVDVIRRGQTHSTHTVELTAGRGHLAVDIPPDLFGSVEIHAWRISKEGAISRDTQVVYVEAPRDLKIEVTPDQKVYRPGTEAKIAFRVTDPDGNPVQAALGLVVVDEAVYALQDMKPGLEKVFFMLEQELMKPRAQVMIGVGLPRIAHGGAPEPIARILLCNVEIPERRWRVNTLEKRFETARTSVTTAFQHLSNYVGQNLKKATRTNPFSNKRELRPDLVEVMTKAWSKRVKPQVDPWGRPITVVTIEKFFKIDLFNHFTGQFSMGPIQNAFNTITSAAVRTDLVERKGGGWAWKTELFEKMNLRDCWGDSLTLERLSEMNEAFDPANIAKLTDDERRAHIFERMIALIAKGGEWSETIVNDLAVRSIGTGKPFTLEELRNRWNGFSREVVEQQARVPRLQRIWLAIQERAVKRGVDAIATRNPWKLKNGLLKEMVESRELPAWAADFKMKDLKPAHSFRADLLALNALMRNWQPLMQAVRNYCRRNGHWERRQNRFRPPADLIERMREARAITDAMLRDPYGDRIRIEIDLNKRFVKWNHDMRHIDFVSAGPDGKLGTKDDIRLSRHNYSAHNRTNQPYRTHHYPRDNSLRQKLWQGLRGGGRGIQLGREEMEDFRANRAPRAPMPVQEAAPMKARRKGAVKKDGAAGSGGQFKEPARIRTWFPETLFWRPELITDAEGRAELTMPIADSITEWRMSCSCSSADGRLGSTTQPVRVFQDFFADIDFPVQLTRHDLVWVPVAVYNYMKEPQTVKLEVQPEDWFELKDNATKTIEIQPNQVTAVHFKIEAKKVGRHALTVKAYGTKLSDALRRQVEVVPDGKRFETVINDRLPKKAEYTLEIPENTIPGSSKIFFKIYPGVLAQIMDGLDGMLRLPGG